MPSKGVQLRHGATDDCCCHLAVSDIHGLIRQRPCRLRELRAPADFRRRRVCFNSKPEYQWWMGAYMPRSHDKISTASSSFVPFEMIFPAIVRWMYFPTGACGKPTPLLRGRRTNSGPPLPTHRISIARMTPGATIHCRARGDLHDGARASAGVGQDRHGLQSRQNRRAGPSVCEIGIAPPGPAPFPPRIREVLQ